MALTDEYLIAMIIREFLKALYSGNVEVVEHVGDNNAEGERLLLFEPDSRLVGNIMQFFGKFFYSLSGDDADIRMVAQGLRNGRRRQFKCRSNILDCGSLVIHWAKIRKKVLFAARKAKGNKV